MKIFYMVTNINHPLGINRILHKERRPDDFVVTSELGLKYAANKTDGNKRLIPEFIIPDPIIDHTIIDNPSPKRLGPKVVTILATKVVIERFVVDIPLQEVQDTANRKAAKAMLADVRDQVGTPAEQLERMSKVVFRLGKDALG